MPAVRDGHLSQIVDEEFSLGLHALSLDTKAPSEV
jgi:stress-induced morphogen